MTDEEEQPPKKAPKEPQVMESALVSRENTKYIPEKRIRKLDE